MKHVSALRPFITHIQTHILTKVLPYIISLACLFGSGLAHAQPEPLEPEQAFRFSARAIDAQTIEARWQIADGYYMYRDKFSFTVSGSNATLGKAVFPAGKIKEDENFGQVETYRKEVRITVPISAASGSVITLKTSSQGCADLGICYPPIPQAATLTLPSATLSAATRPASADTTSLTTTPTTIVQTQADAAPTNPESEQGRLGNLLRSGSLWLILSSFFGFGLLLSFTPCVLPMVPILSGIIVHHGHAITRGRAFVLSSTYSLGMAITYAAAGVAAGLSGTLLSNALQNAWVLGGFALIFVVLSLAMFGFYELQLPTAVQSKLSDKANQQGGSIASIALMGALSAIIVGPCVAAPLAAALLYIAQSGDAVLGGLALFALALGMGLPLVLVGTFSRSLLPKTGPWMEAVKKFFGVLLLATALWLVKPVVPAWFNMLGWALLLIVPAIYLHALDPLPVTAKNWTRFWKGVGLAMLISGTTILVGLLGGSRDPLQPLDFLRATAGNNASHSNSLSTNSLPFITIHSIAELDAQLARTHKPVMLDFYADWCVSCIELEKFTFSDPAVAKKLAEFTLLRADVTANTPAEAALLKRFSLFGPPGILFFNAKGQENDALRIIGYQSPTDFLPVLSRAASL